MRNSLAELMKSKKWYKLKHPTLSVDWYIKWIASFVLLGAMMIRTTGMYPIWDMGLSLVGCMGWLVVSVMWRDRALIILNVIASFILGSGLLKHFLT